MKTDSYRSALLKRLASRTYAQGYLETLFTEQDRNALLLGIKDVVDAQGGISRLAKRLKLSRQSLYKAFSQGGNPTIQTLTAVLNALGLRLSVAVKLDRRAA